MTPTAQIAAIRQRAEIAKEYGASSVAWSQDIPFLLQQIDIHQSALRALVAELRARQAEHAANGETPSEGEVERCADALERLLESEP